MVVEAKKELDEAWLDLRTADSAWGIDGPHIHCEEDENSDLNDRYDKKNKP
jgi:hypothetical protein